MDRPALVSEKELREDLLCLAEDLHMALLLLECLSRADLSDCCEPYELEPLYRYLLDCVRQHAHEIGYLAETLVSPPKTPCPAPTR